MADLDKILKTTNEEEKKEHLITCLNEYIKRPEAVPPMFRRGTDKVLELYTEEKITTEDVLDYIKQRLQMPTDEMWSFTHDTIGLSAPYYIPPSCEEKRDCWIY